LANDPSESLAVIGVTGTNGKTTTTCLVSSVFDRAGYQVGLSGTLGYCDSRTTWPTDLTTPGAETLARWLAHCRDAGCTHAVLEASSHALSHSRTAGIPLQ